MQRFYQAPKIIQQIVKFAFVGAANTALDFGVLNMLMFIFGVDGLRYSIFKTIAFLVALFNSYLWNKNWVFDADKRPRNVAKERTLFIAMSCLGLAVNSVVSSVVYVFTTQSLIGLAPVVAANLGAAAGVLTVMTINFLSYKFLVFKPI
jgi:putative flippase GtrA